MSFFRSHYRLIKILVLARKQSHFWQPDIYNSAFCLFYFRRHLLFSRETNECQETAIQSFIDEMLDCVKLCTGLTSGFLMNNQFFKKDDDKNWLVKEEVENFMGLQSKPPCSWLSRYLPPLLRCMCPDSLSDCVTEKHMTNFQICGKWKVRRQIQQHLFLDCIIMHLENKENWISYIIKEKEKQRKTQ